MVRYGVVASNLALLAIVGAFILHSSSAPNDTPLANAPLASTVGAEEANPLDRLSSADVAVHIARVTALPEATAVVNNADSVSAYLAVAASDDRVIAKPQIVATALKSKKDIIKYTTASGDTLSALASKFGVTSDTIRLSNNLSTETLDPGKELTISPVNGLIYTVKAGDTPDSLAAKYRVNQEQLIAFNDAEVAPLIPGDQIVIPDAQQPAANNARSNNGNASPAYTSVGSGYAFGNDAIFDGNGYTRGNCTWWAAFRRMQVGKPVPSNLGNAFTWNIKARQLNPPIPTGNVPQKYAVIQAPGNNHVGFVENVNEDGSILVSDMNFPGFNRVSNRTLSAAEAAKYDYIY